VNDSVAAPELIGKWGIAPIPGHKKEGGTIDRSTGGIVQQAAIILKQTNYPREAWSFLKWWTSADIQTQFGKELEALIGVEARWNTANKEAFTGLSWRKEDLDIIKYSWDWVKEMQVVLGGYFTGRHVFNAWNRVVFGDMGVRDSLEQAVEDINKELRMKQEEYGFEVID
jgi:ABC-type glycerol-3-phosphate transport system substrate-binding protein